MAVKKRQI